MEALPFRRRVALLNMSLTEEEDECAARALADGEQAWQRPDTIQRLHHQIAQHWQTPWVASFMGGRAALFAIIHTLGLKPGDAIVIPAFTCQCVTNAISFNGIEIQFADIETDTYGMSARALEKAITPQTRAVLIQYTFGLVCRDIDRLLALARQHGLYVIEDCAHATGGKWQDKLLGTLGDIAFFSSERSKIVNTIHGGWVITANPQLGERLQAVYQQTPDADAGYIRRLLQTLRHICAGEPAQADFTPVPQMQRPELQGLFTPQYAWRMAEPVAELLALQLAKLPDILHRRRQGAAFWQQWARVHGFAQPKTRADARDTWLRFPVLLSSPRDGAAIDLERMLNVETGIWFSTVTHPHPCDLPECPQGMRAARRCVNLPTWLTEI